MATSKRQSHPGNGGMDTGEAAEQATGVAGRAAERVQEFAGAAANAASDLKNRAGDAFDAARDASYQAARATSRQIESHPLSSVGAAFVAGLVVGVLIDRLVGRD